MQGQETQPRSSALPFFIIIFLLFMGFMIFILPHLSVQPDISASVGANNAAEASSAVHIDWRNLNNVAGSSLDLNDYLARSTDHAESEQIVSALQTIQAKNGGRLKKIGDGRSNGSVTMMAGIMDGIGRVGILYVAGNRVAYAVVQASAIPATGCVPDFCINLKNGWYIDPRQLAWKCAWFMSDEIGKQAQPESTLLSVGEGWERWTLIQQEYNLYVEVFSLPLPSWK